MVVDLRKYDSHVRTQAAYMCNAEAFLGLLENLANQQGPECYTEYSRAFSHIKAVLATLPHGYVPSSNDVIFDRAANVENIYAQVYARSITNGPSGLVHETQFRTDVFPLNFSKLTWVKYLPQFKSGFPEAAILNTVDKIKEHLDKGIPVIVGCGIDPVTADNAYNVIRETNDRNHAILIVGYTDTDFIFKNTNGIYWGDNGYGYLLLDSMKDRENLDGFSLASKPDFPSLYWWRKNKILAWLVKSIGFDIDFST